MPKPEGFLLLCGEVIDPATSVRQWTVELRAIGQPPRLWVLSDGEWDGVSHSSLGGAMEELQGNVPSNFTLEWDSEPLVQASLEGEGIGIEEGKTIHFVYDFKTDVWASTGENPRSTLHRWNAVDRACAEYFLNALEALA
ncbi:MAG: hypothetical protein QM757_26500 [Paludibaculum sp.]